MGVSHSKERVGGRVRHHRLLQCLEEFLSAIYGVRSKMAPRMLVRQQNKTVTRAVGASPVFTEVLTGDSVPTPSSGRAFIRAW